MGVAGAVEVREGEHKETAADVAGNEGAPARPLAPGERENGVQPAVPPLLVPLKKATSALYSLSGHPASPPARSGKSRSRTSRARARFASTIDAAAGAGEVEEISVGVRYHAGAREAGPTGELCVERQSGRLCAKGSKVIQERGAAAGCSHEGLVSG